jgi:hypothetical protein
LLNRFYFVASTLLGLFDLSLAGSQMIRVGLANNFEFGSLAIEQ